MSTPDVIVVGGGLFGSVITDHLRACRGFDVMQIDNPREEAGSRPAACLMKPSWYSSVPSHNQHLGILDNLYGLQRLSFNVGFLKMEEVYWVPPKKILKRPNCLEGWVKRVDRRAVEWKPRRRDVVGEIGGWIVTEARLAVVVAAGVWTIDLLPGVDVRPRTGMALLWPGQTAPNFISPWAPYRQIVGFDRRDGFWAGDGTANKSFLEADERKSYDRITAKINFPSTPIKFVGHRPYCPGVKPALCEEWHNGVWVATGGAKNGTIAAAWAADKIGRAL